MTKNGPASACPAEVIEYSLSLYNSGATDKYVYIEDVTDPGMVFGEITRDQYTDRYQCLYDLPVFERRVEE